MTISSLLAAGALLAAALAQTTPAPEPDNNHYDCTLTQRNADGSITIEWGVDGEVAAKIYLIGTTVRKGRLRFELAWVTHSPDLAIEPDQKGSLFLDGLPKGRNRLELHRPGVSYYSDLLARYAGPWSDRSGKASIFGDLREIRALMTGNDGVEVVALRRKNYEEIDGGLLTPAILDAPAAMARDALPEIARVTAHHVKACTINNERDIVI